MHAGVLDEIFIEIWLVDAYQPRAQLLEDIARELSPERRLLQLAVVNNIS